MPVRRSDHDDDGAIAVLFAIVVLALAGMGALMVDVGALYSEGRQLQNGAENAALDVARTCVLSTTGCDPAAATAMTNANANDSTSDPYLICGTGPALSACPSAPQRPRFDCRPPSGSAPYAEVRTSTRRPDGSQVLPGWLIHLVDKEYTGTTVQACARASYGAPSGLQSQTPLVISYCDWKALTNATGLSTPPPYPPFPPHNGWFDPATNPSSDHVRVWSKEQDADKAGTCTGPAGSALPGGFGWVDTSKDLDGTASGCTATTDTSGNVSSNTGASGETDCLQPYLGKLIYVPVYDTATGSGTNGTYHVMGYAAFYLTGYSFPGSSGKGASGFAAPLTKRPCQPNEGNCISGFFTAAIAPAGGTIGGPSMGVTIVRTTG